MDEENFSGVEKITFLWFQKGSELHICTLLILEQQNFTVASRLNIVENY